MAKGSVEGAPLLLLRLEGGMAFLAATVAYGYLGQSWWLYGLVFLAPDLSMLAYLVNPRFGALIYNLVHTSVGPLALGAMGLAMGHALLMALAMIWLAHIGIDRLLGFGLKYGSAFADTHLGRLRAAGGLR
jgi:Domain of unknown function (DUF4260)